MVYRHALRNALIPVLTVVGLQFGSLLSGAIVTETIFSWPGIGRLTLSAISNRDYALGARMHSGGGADVCGGKSADRHRLYSGEPPYPRMNKSGMAIGHVTR